MCILILNKIYLLFLITYVHTYVNILINYILMLYYSTNKWQHSFDILRHLVLRCCRKVYFHESQQRCSLMLAP